LVHAPAQAAPIIWQPAWSPDGTMLAYIEPADGGIFIVRPDGTDRRRLTPAPGPDAEDKSPIWAGNNRILFLQQAQEGVHPPQDLFAVDVGTGQIVHLA